MVGATKESSKFFCVLGSHVIVARSNVRQSVFVHLSDIYKVVNLFGDYDESLPMVPNNEY